MNIELRNIECRRVDARLPSFAEATEDRSAMWFFVDKVGGGGLDDWEVKIVDFVVLLGKDAKKYRMP